MEPLEFSYTATADDHVRAIRAYTLRRPEILPLFILLGIVFLFIICIVLGSIVLTLLGETQVTDIAVLLKLLSGFLPCTLFCLALPAYLLYIGPYLTGQRFKKHEDKVGLITYVLDDEHIRIDSSLTKSETAWNIFSKAIETKEYYLLVHTMNKRMIQFIPKRAFETPQQEADFRRYVEKNIGPIK
jgi:hypothetical protein